LGLEEAPSALKGKGAEPDQSEKGISRRSSLVMRGKSLNPNPWMSKRSEISLIIFVLSWYRFQRSQDFFFLEAHESRGPWAAKEPGGNDGNTVLFKHRWLLVSAEKTK
jgi:hypothetical protein